MFYIRSSGLQVFLSYAALHAATLPPFRLKSNVSVE